jgi:hypothetical protein
MARPKGSGRKQASRRVRVRSRPLDQVDEAKLAVALALMSRRLLEQQRADDASDGRSAGQEAV